MLSSSEDRLSGLLRSPFSLVTFLPFPFFLRPQHSLLSPWSQLLTLLCYIWKTSCQGDERALCSI